LSISIYFLPFAAILLLSSLFWRQSMNLGLKAGDSAIIIATAEHLQALEERIKDTGVDVATARMQDRYIALEAGEALTRFMVKGWPDDKLFTNLVTDLIMRARVNSQRVRAFGEMVALLWARGDQAATIRLEHL
jgi:hypothetical protein